MSSAISLPVVDALALSPEHRALLEPDADVRTAGGTMVRRPRYYYEIDSRETARRVELAPHFGLWEFIDVDVREAPPLRSFPRYVPCAVAALAASLELFRIEVGAPVRIAANGGFRSPAMQRMDPASRHTWGTAANIYRIGEDALTDGETVLRYTTIAARVLPWAWCRPFGPNSGESIDHLHVDIGYVVSLPGR